MSFLTKPVYVRFRVRTLLILLIVLGLIVAGVVLYKSYVFHNLFFQTLSIDKVDSIYIYNYYERGSTALSMEETDDVISLLRNIRLKEEPFKNYAQLGDQGADYHIKLKNGISFDLNLSGGDPGMYIINDEAYSIGYWEDQSAADDFKNIWCLEELHSAYIKEYYPNNE